MFTSVFVTAAATIGLCADTLTVISRLATSRVTFLDCLKINKALFSAGVKGTATSVASLDPVLIAYGSAPK